MSYVLKCDKCGRVIDNDKDKTTLSIEPSVQFKTNLSRASSGETIEDRLEYHLCPECRLKFNGWMFG